MVERTFFKEIAATERHFGDYSPGRFAWQLDTVIRMADIPARGSQGFWEWQTPAELEEAKYGQAALLDVPRRTEWI